MPAFWSAALLHRFRSTRCSYVSAIEKSAIKLRNSKTEHRREAYGVRKAYVWLYAKFAKTNMTRRLSGRWREAPHVRQLRVRDPRAGAGLPAMQLPDCGT